MPHLAQDLIFSLLGYWRKSEGACFGKASSSVMVEFCFGPFQSVGGVLIGA
jgi:hypothetical protein